MMPFLRDVADLFMTLDVKLQEVITNYGAGTYIILGLVIFLETGVVVTPFLPGDTLRVAAGTFAGTCHLDIRILVPVLSGAAVIGVATDSWIGRAAGKRLVGRWFLRAEPLERTHGFFERHGPKTVVLGRFVPIVRTFAP